MIKVVRFARIYLWEFIQNLPLSIGFIGGMRLWEQSKWAAIGWVIAGGITGALLIAFTEHRIAAGHRESARMVIGNILAFSILMVALMAYLHAGWSNWKTDFLAGSCAGFVLDRMQTPHPPGRHTLAMAAAGSCGLALVRLLAGISNWPAGILVLTIMLTLIVVILDYRALLKAESP